MWHETAALRSVFLCAGADGEEDGGLAEVLGLLLALLLWNWYWGCTGRVYFTFTYLIYIYVFDLKWGFYIKHRSGSFWLPHPAPALEWRDSHGCSQEATAGSFWVLHQVGSERRCFRSATSRMITNAVHAVLSLFPGEILHLPWQVTSHQSFFFSA